MTPPRTPALPAALLFVSGACALVYQVVWLRQLRLVFGASTSANAAVLAIFMGGLGVGGWALGRWVDAHPRPLRAYAGLELGVALLAAISPAWLAIIRWLYVSLGGTPSLGDTTGALVRLGLSLLVLGPPTVLMGGTLPALMRAVSTEADHGRRTMGLLYATNTTGSVVGTLLATFVAIEAWGTSRTLWAAVVCNLGVAAAARWADRAMPTLPRTEAAAAGDAPPPWILGAAALSGFVFFLMELVWYRMLAPLLGGSSYSFGMILAVALTGIGIGSALYHRWAHRNLPTPLAFGVTAVAEAVCLALPLAIGDDFAVWAANLRPWGEQSFGALVGMWATIATVAILPGAIVSGFQFPLLVGLMGRGAKGVARQVGLVVAANTAGSILGSLAGGFGVLPLLGAVGTWRLVTVLLGLTGGWMAWQAREERRTALLVGLGATIALALASRAGPTAAWRHSPIGAGRFDLADASPREQADRLQEVRRSTLWEADGVESAIGLQSLDGYAFVIHGKVDGHVIGDAATNVWLGLLPTLLHAKPQEVLVVGLGTGQTGGWAAQVAEVNHVDIVELEPAIAHIAQRCAPSNYDVLNNPKVDLHFGDAREWLLTTPATYDVIISEPSNPYRAGIASLFSVEFYQAVAQRLRADGLFLQWIQAYELSPETLAIAVSTLQAVFSDVEIWEGEVDGDLLVVARSAPVTLDAERISARLQQAPFAQALSRTWRVHGRDGLLSSFVGNNGLATAIAANAPHNTDDHPIIEFGFAKQVGQDVRVSVSDLRRQADRGGWATPPIHQTDDGWGRLEARYAKAIAGRSPPRVPTGVPAAMAARMAARHVWAEGDLSAVVPAWTSQDDAPQHPVDLLALAEGYAAIGDPRALALAQELAQHSEGEAALVRAAYFAQQQDAQNAVAALLQAFNAAQTDPWIHPRALRRGLVRATALGAENPAVARGFASLLLTPFAVGNIDENRHAAAIQTALLSDTPGQCVAAFAAIEPYPPLRPALLAQRAACYEREAHPLALPAAEEHAWVLSLADEPAHPPAD